MGFHINCGCIPQRFWVCILSWQGLTISYIMRFCLSMAITVMVKPKQGKVDPYSCPFQKPPPKAASDVHYQYDWDEQTQGMILSSFFWGYVITQVPGGMIADRFGPRLVLVIGVGATSLFTYLTPLAAHFGDAIGLVIVRIFLGLSQGFVYASLHTVVANWVPTQERGLWGTLVFSGAHFGNFLSMLVTGSLIGYLGEDRWPYIFYLYGTIGLLWTVLFYLTTYSHPNDHPKLKPKEQEILDAYIDAASKKELYSSPNSFFGLYNLPDRRFGKNSLHQYYTFRISLHSPKVIFKVEGSNIQNGDKWFYRMKVKSTPWKGILKSGPVWAIVVAMIGHDWGLFALVIDLPKFMKSVLHFNVKQNGLYTSMGYLMIWCVGIGSGYLVDWLDSHNHIRRTWNRIIFTTIASVGPSLGLLGGVYSGCNRTMAVAFLVIGMACMGTFYPSLKVNPIDLSPNHAGTLGAMGHGIGAFSGIIVPYLIGALTPNSYLSEWRLVFWITFAVMSITNVFYVFFASGHLQPWNTAEEEGG